MPCEDFIDEKNYAPKNLGRILVIGLGKSGCSAVRYLSPLLGSRVTSIFVAAGKQTEDAKEFAQEFANTGVEFAFDCESFSEHFDLCIASPGISQFSDFYRNAAAASAEIISEVEFAWRESNVDSTWICVTGTNGKTTTTSLVAHILQNAEQSANAVGNIGDVCLDAVAKGNTKVYVAELSSYQLASTVLFKPKVSIILNITPDHLSWHNGFENYKQAKFKALENMSCVPGAVSVLDATDDCVRAKIRELKAQDEATRGFAYIPVGTASGLHESMIARCGAAASAYSTEDGALTVEYLGEKHILACEDELQIKGTHNLANALAASACAVALGVEDSAIKEALLSFEPLEHRIEPCGCVNGVSFFNDSKGTNVDATLKAYTAFAQGSLIVLLGGRDKNTPLDELVAQTVRCARVAILYGESRERFAQAFESAPSTLEIVYATGMKDAFEQACKMAKQGENILLSPACASFDEFSCFEERGEVFKGYVAAFKDASNG